MLYESRLAAARRLASVHAQLRSICHFFSVRRFNYKAAGHDARLAVRRARLRTNCPRNPQPNTTWRYERENSAVCHKSATSASSHLFPVRPKKKPRRSRAKGHAVCVSSMYEDVFAEEDFDPIMLSFDEHLDG
jgi:hypothetical protein